YLPALGEVRLRLTAIGDDMDVLDREIEDQIRKCLPLIGIYIYGYDQESLQEVIGKLLKNTNKKVALAESCTGGYLSHLITCIPGSSTYFNGSVVPYHNKYKVSELGVSVGTIESLGA